MSDNELEVVDDVLLNVLADRIEASLNRNGPMPPASTGISTQCWIWTGPVDKSYPRLTIGRRLYTVRKLLWLFTYGVQPDGPVVVACGNEMCLHHLRLRRKEEPVQSATKRRLSTPANTILNETSVREIRALAERGEESQRIIAERYGVTQGIVSQIHRRRVWQHVD